MEIAPTEYYYRFENAAVAFSADPMTLATIAISIVAVAVAATVGPYVYGYAVYRAKEFEKIEKRRTLQNLISMKDVQTELEEEMKKALTNMGATS